MQFSQVQRSLAIQAMDEAEDRTGRYYCIPPHRWQALPYDLLTCQDLEWEPLPEVALAKLQLVQRQSPFRGIVRDFYRIQLNDPAILATAQREQLIPNLYPFLVYILTHEMVHMVRLSTILADPLKPLSCVESEESRVHRISRQILAGPAEFRSILDKFCAADRWKDREEPSNL